MFNHYMKARAKKPKNDYIQLNKARLMTALSTIGEKREILDCDLQTECGWGNGVHERLVRVLKTKCIDEVEWNKKTRIWKFIPLKRYEEET